MATHIKGKSLTASTTYEPSVLHTQGICKDTVENINPPFTLQHGVMAPGKTTRAHYHTECARGNYVIKGRIRYIFGPKHDQQIFDTEAGDYVYTPRGEIHSQINLSDTEPAEFVGVYVGVTDRDLSGKTFVEPPLDK